MKIVKKHSAGGLIIKDGKVLLIHWDPPRNSYDFPKGAIDKGETLEQACIREVREETGYQTEIIRYIGATNYEYDWVDGTHHEKTVDYFLLKTDQNEPDEHGREAHETFQNEWVPFEQAMTLLTKDIDKEILSKVLT